jgi:hypothetical protein
VELTHSTLNPRFNISVVFTANYSFSVGDVPVDNVTLLVTDFVNLNIKSAQSFKGAHRSRVCVHIYISIYVYTVKEIMFDGGRSKKNTASILSYSRMGESLGWEKLGGLRTRRSEIKVSVTGFGPHRFVQNRRN